MSMRANPTVIGAFVVGAVVLFLVALLVWGGTGLFRSKLEYVLFFDEPSAGLDPISSRRLDDLILELRASLGATMVVVTHELPSIFAIADTAVFLDAETRTMIALGNPKKLRDESPEVKVRTFLTRGREDQGGPAG